MSASFTARISRRAIFCACVTFLVVFALTTIADAIPVSEGRRTVTLSDGTQVHLILDADSNQLAGDALTRLVNQQGGHRYYYLPANLRLAKRPDGVPEFLLLKFTTEQRETAGGISGAVLHFLMEYGLTPAQVSELEKKLEATHDRLMGALPMRSDGDNSTVLITSASLKDPALTKTLIAPAKAPLLPGEEVAAAALLNANGAQLLAATLDKDRAIADCSVTFYLGYVVVTPAVRASATYHSRKLQTERESLRKAWEHSHKTTGRFLWWETSGEDTYSYNEVRDQFQFLMDQKVVEFNYIETVPDDRVTKIREAVFQSFLDSFFKADKASPEQMMQSQNEQQKPDDGPGIKGDHFRSSIYRSKRSVWQEDRYWNFNAALPITDTVMLTGNLASWYDGVRDNKANVASVNLNDPFFTHRDINFILDLDAKEMFDEAVNYVTINVRKNRSSGRPFEDHRTIDAKYLKSSGVAATMTYARGEDTNPEVYQYQAQWSLRGGNVFPENPPWRTGTWEGVTLAPPVRPLTVELEGDLDALKAKEITRVTAEIHTSQFGKEHSDEIQLSVAGQQAVVSKKMFRDRDMETYAYRLIFNHKTAGKLVGPWVKNQTDGYIYAVIPEDMLTAEAFKTRAQTLATGVMENVLEKLGGKLEDKIDQN